MTPLVPACVDLRDFPYMPLEVVRLRDSDLAAIASDGAFRAAVILWCAAWHQVPAASLPDDDRMLARLAGFGREIPAWLEVKEEAMRNFVKCDDGRLYHTTIAKKAIEAWDAKQRQRERTEAARESKLLKAANGGSDKKRKSSATESVTGSKGREGKGIDSATTDPDGSAAAAAGQPPPPDLRKLCEEAAGQSYGKGFQKILDLVEAGVSVEDRILPMIRTVAADLRRESSGVHSWGYFASAIADPTREPEAIPAVDQRIWCPLDSPRFAAANLARAKRGAPVLNAIPVPSRGGKGQYFDPCDLAGMEGGGA